MHGAPPPSGPTEHAVAAAIEVLQSATSTEALEALDGPALRVRFDQLRRVEGLGTAGQARTVARLARTGVVRDDGASSTSSWIQRTARRSTREAAQLSRLAQQAEQLPRTLDAVAAGAITPEAADAIARAASDGRLGPASDVDAQLVGVARATSPERLRREIRHREQAVDGARLLRDERRQYAARRITLADRPDGLVGVTGQLPGEMAERLRTCLDAFDLPDATGTPDDQRRNPGQRLADALDGAVSQLLAHGDVPAGAGRVPQLTVHVELATIDADLTHAESAERPVASDDPRWARLPVGRTVWGRQLSPQAVRRILCDAGVARVVTAGGSLPVDLGRSTRTWSSAQRRAVDDRDRGCRGPGCDRPPGWTQTHHLRWWRHGGSTSVTNALSLCQHCHRLVHDRDWQVELDPVTGDVTWTTPDGRVLLDRRRTA
jgi:hypothetical protein